MERTASRALIAGVEHRTGYLLRGRVINRKSALYE